MVNCNSQPLLLTRGNIVSQYPQLFGLNENTFHYIILGICWLYFLSCCKQIYAVFICFYCVNLLSIYKYIHYVKHSSVEQYEITLRDLHVQVNTTLHNEYGFLSMV